MRNLRASAAVATAMLALFVVAGGPGALAGRGDDAACRENRNCVSVTTTRTTVTVGGSTSTVTSSVTSTSTVTSTVTETSTPPTVLTTVTSTSTVTDTVASTTTVTAGGTAAPPTVYVFTATIVVCDPPSLCEVP